MQTNYNFGPNVAMPGLPFDAGMPQRDVVTFKAGAIIPFGVLCELVLTNSEYLAVPLKDSTTGGSFAPQWAGVSMYDPLGAEQSYVPYVVPPSISGGSTMVGYPVGFSVPFMRKGRIWVQWDGNTGTAVNADGTIQVWHSSDGTHLQGVVTTLAAQTTVGQEIDNLPNAANAAFRTFNFSPGAANVTNVFGMTYGVVPLSVSVI